MRFEIVTGSGRGVHLAAPGQEQTICMRPVLTRTGEEGSARTPHLCEACARGLAALSRSSAGERGSVRAWGPRSAPPLQAHRPPLPRRPPPARRTRPGEVVMTTQERRYVCRLI